MSNQCGGSWTYQKLNKETFFYWKCNLPMTRSVRVCWSVIISLKGGKLDFHAPIDALVFKSVKPLQSGL